MKKIKNQILYSIASFFSKTYLIKFPPKDINFELVCKSSVDPIRYASIALAISRVNREEITGSIAEVGVWRGQTSKLMHSLSPDKALHLFDTFEGFPEKDIPASDSRFQDTNVNIVLQNIGDDKNIHIHKGYFPDTAVGLENEIFSFVMLDLDLYQPTKAAMEFFYPKLSPGGYIFVHDFNSPESDFAISRAVNEFMLDKSEGLIEIPDTWGSVIIRKAK